MDIINDMINERYRQIMELQKNQDIMSSDQIMKLKYQEKNRQLKENDILIYLNKNFMSEQEYIK